MENDLKLIIQKYIGLKRNNDRILINFCSYNLYKDLNPKIINLFFNNNIMFKCSINNIIYLHNKPYKAEISYHIMNNIIFLEFLFYDNIIEDKVLIIKKIKTCFKYNNVNKIIYITFQSLDNVIFNKLLKIIKKYFLVIYITRKYSENCAKSVDYIIKTYNNKYNNNFIFYIEYKNTPTYVQLVNYKSGIYTIFKNSYSIVTKNIIYNEFLYLFILYLI